MIGDVNIFLKGVPGDQDFEAEAEIMIAGELALWDIYTPLPFHLIVTQGPALTLAQNQTIAEKGSPVVLCN